MSFFEPETKTRSFVQFWDRAGCIFCEIEKQLLCQTLDSCKFICALRKMVDSNCKSAGAKAASTMMMNFTPGPNIIKL